MKVWFITGASRGLGAALVEAVLANGGAVVATARNPTEIVPVIGEHAHLLRVELDVTDPRLAHTAADAAINRFGRVDVLVNNAGFGMVGAVEEATEIEIQQIFATNVFGLLSVTRAVLPYMRARKSGHIINVSSRGGYGAYPGWGIYCATKFAVEALTEALAMELEPLGVRATIVQPGSFRSHFHAEGSLKMSADIDDYAEIMTTIREAAAEPDSSRPGDPAKLASALLTLVDADTPPLRLPLGPDAVSRIEEKHRHVVADLEAWRPLALSTAG